MEKHPIGVPPFLVAIVRKAGYHAGQKNAAAPQGPKWEGEGYHRRGGA